MSASSALRGEEVSSLAQHDFIVVPHHFDRLRCPAADRQASARASFERALTWNIFRTLELLPPAFWLRRLRARLQDKNPGVPAPTVGRVSLWQTVDPSPTLALAGTGTPVLVDVVIETEFSVWGLAALVGRDIGDEQDGGVDRVARTLDAIGWYAAGRECCFGLILTDPANAPRAVARVRHYARHRSHIVNVLGGHGESLRHLGSIGIARWRDLLEILGDCAGSDALAPAERAHARRALDWVDKRKASLG